MKYRSVESIVGLIVIGIIVLSMYYAYNLNQSMYYRSYKIKATFASACGINVGSQVKISGIEVGKVVSMDLDLNTYRVNVIMSIQKNVPIPLDSFLLITSPTILDVKHIEIKPGSSEINASDGAMLENTRSSINIEDLIMKLATKIN